MNGLKILIINPFGIGDVIFSTPLIEALKKSYPECRISYICNGRTFEILNADPNLEKVFVYEKDYYRELWRSSKIRCLKEIINLLKSIRRERFDISIDLSLGYQTSMILKFLGIRKRLGFNYRNRGRFLSDKIDIDGFADKHVIDYFLSLLRPIGIEMGNHKIEPRIYVGANDVAWADNFLNENGVKKEDLFIGIVAGCGASWGKDANYRRWSPWKFADVADSLIERYKARVVILGEAREDSVCSEVAKTMKKGSIYACGKTTLGELAAILKRCNLVITNDGGPLHLAVALGVKSVSIFGPVNEDIYGPYPKDSRHITIVSNELCRPCYKNFKYEKCKTLNCLKNIRPETVLKAATALIEGDSRKMLEYQKVG